MTKKITRFLLLLSLLPLRTFAHEYWLEPESFFLAPNEKTIVRLFVGDGLVKDREERVYQAEKTPMFQAVSGSWKSDLKAGLTEGATPIHVFSGAKPGTYLLAMERNWSYITLEPDKFEDYLRTDGMDYIIGERGKLGESAKEGRERYGRFIKSLIQVGEKRDSAYKKNLGLKLEIIPLENPYSKKIGDMIGFQVLFDGKPLANRVVFADNRDAETQRATTDAAGKVTFRFDRKGLWLIRLVTMQRCPRDCGEADWESFWGALSFGM